MPSSQVSNGVTFHPFAERFPLMSDAELAKLSESIKKHGLRVPLVRRKSDGVVLDGRNRYRACEIAGVEVRFEVRDVDEEQSLELIADLNIDRRHLNESQRGMLAKEFFDCLQKAREKQAEDLRQTFGESPKPAHRPSDGRKEDAAKAAKKFNVSDETIRKAGKVKEKAPDLAKKVEAGEVSVSAAAKQVREAEKPHVSEKVPTDELGVPLTQALLLPFQSREKFKEVLSTIRKLESQLDALAKTQGGELLRHGLKPHGDGDKRRYKDGDLETCKRHVKFAVPFAVCPYCVHRAKCVKVFKDCKACAGLGWLAEANYKTAPPDYRKTVEELVAK